MVLGKTKYCIKDYKNSYNIEIYKSKENYKKGKGEFLSLVIDGNFYLWDVNQFIERWNSPVERIPRDYYRFVIFHDPDCWLAEIKTYVRNSCTNTELFNERDPSCRCQVSGVSVSGRQIFPREAVC